MLKVKDLPLIRLDEIGEDVIKLLKENKVQFKGLGEAPKLLQKFSNIYAEPYIAYKDTIYVPNGHIDAAQSKDHNQRIIATSKILPWVYAIKNGSVSSWHSFLFTMFTAVRYYYFLYEFSLLKAHNLPADTADLIAIGFISTRKNILGLKKNEDKILTTVKGLLQTKIDRLAV